MFNAFLSPRAVPATPEERLGASAEHLPEACCLRPVCRGSASPCSSRGYIWVRCALRPVASQPVGLPPRGMLVPLLLDASRRHAGDRATLLLSDS